MKEKEAARKKERKKSETPPRHSARDRSRVSSIYRRHGTGARHGRCEGERRRNLDGWAPYRYATGGCLPSPQPPVPVWATSVSVCFCGGLGRLILPSHAREMSHCGPGNVRVLIFVGLCCLVYMASASCKKYLCGWSFCIHQTKVAVNSGKEKEHCVQVVGTQRVRRGEEERRQGSSLVVVKIPS